MDMSGFKSVIGHERIIEHFQNAVRLDKVSHAYILNGENGSGKYTLAKAFAMTLQCEKKGVESCMECASCKKAIGDNHPDIISIHHEKPNTIGVEDIREQLVSDMMIKPYSGAYKIYIIDEAEKLTVQAQNALLKTMEEPPSYAVIMLLTNNISSFLPTIVSRGITLDLKVVPDKLIKEYLMSELQVPDYKADISVAFAQGNVGKAINIATSDNFNELKEAAFRLLNQINKMDINEVVENTKKISEFKGHIEEYLDILAMWYRDVVLFKASQEVGYIIFKDQLNKIKEQARKSSYEGLEDILEAINKAKSRLKANVNFDLVMELLFLKIKEN
jgi:DNA polymerase III, gamma/tau subunits